MYMYNALIWHICRNKNGFFVKDKMFTKFNSKKKIVKNGKIKVLNLKLPYRIP